MVFEMDGISILALTVWFTSPPWCWLYLTGKNRAWFGIQGFPLAPGCHFDGGSLDDERIATLLWLLIQETFILFICDNQLFQITQQDGYILEPTQFTGLDIFQGGAPVGPIIFPHPPQAEEVGMVVRLVGLQDSLGSYSVCSSSKNPDRAPGWAPCCPGEIPRSGISFSLQTILPNRLMYQRHDDHHNGTSLWCRSPLNIQHIHRIFQ